ncbi:MAG: MFS transporter [Candidatus Binatia bacterium]|nr:MFS transporter [Candidatus Binatia bacterium]
MDPRVNYLLLATAMLGTFFSGTATRIFNIAMPTMANSLGTDLIGISWALLAYQLSNIGLAMIFGRIADLWGREKVFSLGFMVFSSSSLLCGLSPTVFHLIAFRFLQGVGGAMVQSSSRALAAEAVPGELGGIAQGYMTTAHHVGFLLGPAMGGLMIDYLSWRWAFFFLVPIGIFGALLTLGTIKRRPIASHRHSIDYLGAFLLFVTTTTLVLVLDRRTLEILGTETKVAMAVIFTGSLAGLIAHESRARSPIFNLALFKLRSFTLSTLSLLIVTMGYALTSFLLPFYLQDVLQHSPSFIGILFITPPVLTIILAPLSGHLTDRLGPRLPTTLGVAFLLLSLLVGGFFRPDSHWWLPTFLITLGGITNGIFNPAIAVAMISIMPKEHRGFATAVNHVTFGFGNVLGVAVGSLLMTAAFEFHTGLSGVSPTADNPAGFVAALNTTFLIAAALSLIAVFSSAAKADRTL